MSAPGGSIPHADGADRLSRAAARAVVARFRAEYRAPGTARGRKTAILDELERATGYDSRKHLGRMLNAGPAAPRRPPGRPRAYGREVSDLIRHLHVLSGGLNGETLQAAIPDLLRLCELHCGCEFGHEARALVRRASPGTIKRRVAERPARLPHDHPRPRRAARANGVRAAIPERRFGEWAGVRPGELQADCLLLSGGRTEGQYLAVLLAVDVRTKWTWLAALPRHNGREVVSALDAMHRRSPFPWRLLHTDNGMEFVNRGVSGWAGRKRIGRSRTRPYRSDDNAYAEQRNAFLRALLGRDRYCGPAACAALARWCEAECEYLNFIRPAAAGARRDRKPGAPGLMAPWRQALATGELTAEWERRLWTRFERIDPAGLQRRRAEALDELWRHAVPDAG